MRPYHRILFYGKEWNRMGVMGYPLIQKKTCFAGPLPTSIEDTLGKSRDIVPFSKWGFTIPSGNDCHSSLLNMAPILTVMIDIYGNPLVMTNSSPWLSQMAHRNRWFSQRTTPPFMASLMDSPGPLGWREIGCGTFWHCTHCMYCTYCTGGQGRVEDVVIFRIWMVYQGWIDRKRDRFFEMEWYRYEDTYR